MPRRRCSTAAQGFDWATAEALAFGSLVAEGHGVRLSGQDSGRGTFSQRHAVWVDQQTGDKYIPLCHVERRPLRGPRQPAVANSACSASNMAIRSPTRSTLVLWEAQFGDFANGAQTIIDQFIAAGEAKWLRASGLVMLLPHGFEGQGPEHSSARLERYLQLCAEDNMQVANCTTPANYFHILRRQMRRDFRKPLILMTPKSLLRHKLAVSNVADFTGESHFRRIVSDLDPPAEGETRRLVLCSGKLAYELMEARDEAGDLGVEIVRIEQLYPFPSEPLVKRLKAMPKLQDVVWAQEEPKNNGAWFFVENLLEQCLAEAGFTGHAAAICRARRQRLAGDRPRQAPRRGAGGLDCRGARASRQAASAASEPAQARSRHSKGKSMATDVKVPALGESITEGTLAEWLKKPGEAVAEDEPIASLETDKVSVEVPSPVAGVLTEQLVKEGDNVAVGAVIARIDEGATASAAAAASAG